MTHSHKRLGYFVLVLLMLSEKVKVKVLMLCRFANRLESKMCIEIDD